MQGSTHLPGGRSMRRAGSGSRRARIAVPLSLVLLAEAGLIVSAAAPAAAAPHPPATTAKTASSAAVGEEAAERLTAAAQDRRVEVVGARTETTTLWANPDGTMSLETHAGPVRFRKGGTWVPVDTTLVRGADGSVRPKGHPHGLRLAGRTGAAGGDLVTLGGADHAVSLGWEGALPEPELKGHRATYVDVRPGTDLVVEATRTGFEQYLVVKDRAAAERAATFSLPLGIKGLKAKKNAADRSLTFTDAVTNKTVATMPTPVMWDASRDERGRAATNRADVDVEVVPAQGEDGYSLSVSADREFLADEDTRYPVTIDPAVYFGTDFDTTVIEGETADLSGASGLRVGREWQKNEARSFISFPRTDAVTGQDILNAELNLFAVWSDTCTPTSWEIWDTGTVSASTRWSNQPAWRTKAATSTQTHGNADCGPRWISEDITSVVKQWSGVDRAVDTLGLRATDGTDTDAFKIFASSEDADAPSILVTYETPADPVKDHVVYWNDVLQQTFREVGGAPGPLARAGAMMHGAIYDAVNSAKCAEGETRCLGAPYLTKATASNGAVPDVNSAIDHAAFDVLRAVFPGIDFDDEIATARSTIPGTVTAEQRSAGTSVGQQAAAAMLEAREGDGAATVVPYPGSETPGYWRPTDGTPAATPGWGLVKPFAMTSGSQFRPAGPAGHTSMSALLASPEYAAQVNEVKELGGAESATRTEDQKQAALFWANDLDSTYKPPGQLFEFTQILSRQEGLTVAANAKMFALVAFSMADAGIASWDSKYLTDIDLWRPESAIQLDGDGNAATTADPNWQPLSYDLQGTHFSPAFPAYTSGHATFGAAWAKAMEQWFGTDSKTFTGTTEDPNALGVTRTFSSFSAAAEENAIGRVWLGVHYRWDGTDGVTLGNRVAQHVGATKLTPNSAADWVKYEHLHNLGGCDALGERLVAEHRWTAYQCVAVNPVETPDHVLYVK